MTTQGPQTYSPFSSMPAVTFDLISKPGQGNRPEVVIRHDYEISAGYLHGVKVQVQRGGHRMSSVAGMNTWVSSPERDRAGDAEVDASSWQRPREDRLSQGPIFDSQFLFHFLTNLYYDLDVSRDLTLQIQLVFEPSQTEQSRASSAVQMQTRVVHGCRRGRSRKASWSNCV